MTPRFQPAEVLAWEVVERPAFNHLSILLNGPREARNGSISFRGAVLSFPYLRLFILPLLAQLFRRASTGVESDGIAQTMRDNCDLAKCQSRRASVWLAVVLRLLERRTCFIACLGGQTRSATAICLDRCRTRRRHPRP